MKHPLWVLESVWNTVLHAHTLVPITKPLYWATLSVYPYLFKCLWMQCMLKILNDLNMWPSQSLKAKITYQIHNANPNGNSVRLCHSCLLLTTLHQIFAYSIILLLLVLSRSLSRSFPLKFQHCIQSWEMLQFINI